MEQQNSFFLKNSKSPSVNILANNSNDSTSPLKANIITSENTLKVHKKAKSRSSNSIQNLLNASHSPRINTKLLSQQSSDSHNSTQVNQTKSSKHSSQKVKQDFHSTKSLPGVFTFGNKFNINNNNSNIFQFKTIDEDTFNRENYELDKKLKESLFLYSNHVKRNEGASVNTLNKVRGVLINWLKDSEQDNLEYNKFMTEKKIKYILKYKEKSESKIKNIENELIVIKNRKGEMEVLLQNGYLNYDVDELTQDIERFANSWEIKTGKSKKMIEKFEEMKIKLPLVQEYTVLKEQEVMKSCEKKELQKIIVSSLQTLKFLSNYYKNLRKKINDITDK